MSKLFTNIKNNSHQNMHQPLMSILASIIANASTTPLSKRISHITHHHINDVCVDVSKLMDIRKSVKRFTGLFSNTPTLIKKIRTKVIYGYVYRNGGLEATLNEEIRRMEKLGWRYVDIKWGIDKYMGDTSWDYLIIFQKIVTFSKL
jgi:hypothetical protein